jgi:hypothetical protein
MDAHMHTDAHMHKGAAPWPEACRRGGMHMDAHMHTDAHMHKGAAPWPEACRRGGMHMDAHMHTDAHTHKGAAPWPEACRRGGMHMDAHMHTDAHMHNGAAPWPEACRRGGMHMDAHMHTDAHMHKGAAPWPEACRRGGMHACTDAQPYLATTGSALHMPLHPHTCTCYLCMDAAHIYEYAPEGGCMCVQPCTIWVYMHCISHSCAAPWHIPHQGGAGAAAHARVHLASPYILPVFESVAPPALSPVTSLHGGHATLANAASPDDSSEALPVPGAATPNELSSVAPSACKSPPAAPSELVTDLEPVAPFVMGLLVLAVVLLTLTWTQWQKALSAENEATRARDRDRRSHVLRERDWLLHTQAQRRERAGMEHSHALRERDWLLHTQAQRRQRAEMEHSLTSEVADMKAEISQARLAEARLTYLPPSACAPLPTEASLETARSQQSQQEAKAGCDEHIRCTLAVTPKLDGPCAFSARREGRTRRRSSRGRRPRGRRGGQRQQHRRETWASRRVDLSDPAYTTDPSAPGYSPLFDPYSPEFEIQAFSTPSEGAGLPPPRNALTRWALGRVVAQEEWEQSAAFGDDLQHSGWSAEVIYDPVHERHRPSYQDSW